MIALVMEGRISAGNVEEEVYKALEELEQLGADSDHPVIVTATLSGKEARIKGLPSAAQLLAGDAAMRAGEGLSKEAWISEVLRGHESDDEAQLGCLKYIVKLWSEGPWPWLREERT